MAAAVESPESAVVVSVVSVVLSEAISSELSDSPVAIQGRTKALKSAINRKMDKIFLFFISHSVKSIRSRCDWSDGYGIMNIMFCAVDRHV